VCAAVFLTLASLGACARPQPVPLTAEGPLAYYGGGTLWLKLPPIYSDAQLNAAATHALRSRGYVVFANANDSDDPLTVRARKGQAGPLSEAQVIAYRTGARTLLEVRIEPFGNDAEGRAVMRAVLTRLGVLASVEP
jgi:hypothetical protein